MSSDIQGAMPMKLPMNVSISGSFPEDEMADGARGRPLDFTTIRLHQLPEDFMLSKQELAKVLGCSCRTIDRLVKCGDIPPGTPMLGRRIWIAGKVRAWIAARAAWLEAEAEKEAQRLRIVLR